ncbi:MAG: hypothetical protein IPG01_06720 [Chitinophagaceae bacterium]|nr:hypothetical protein [Chitinophagaceae bacterium]
MKIIFYVSINGRRSCSMSIVSMLLVMLCFLSCSTGNPEQDEQLGEIDFKVTGKQEAQDYFKKGLLLLHSFEYEDAAENFMKARETDPDFVMAYWGEAMTYNHPLWRFQDKEKAEAVLRLLAPTAEERVTKAKTDVEQDFIRAVNILYGAGDKNVRDDNYAEFMATLFQKYPGHTEVTSFYSLALIGSVEVGRDTIVYGKAADIAKIVIADNPHHPGALHYLIHSYDDPDHAARALDAADAYAKVAPAAGHALHMPSHIYLALGYWDKVVSSNEVAWAASEERKARKQLDNNALGYHSLHWLLYGYLQQERMNDAKGILNDMQRYCDTLPSPRAREHMILLRSTYLVESGDWLASPESTSVKADDLNVSIRAMQYFITGMKAYHRNDLPVLAAVIDTLSFEVAAATKNISEKGGHSCGTVTAAAPNLLDVQYAAVMQMELSAMQAWAKKDTSLTDFWFKKATALENSISYSYGPPTAVKPSNEMYGEWLLLIMKPKEAKLQFELALKASPNRTLSVNGMAAADAMMNNTAALVKK